MTYLGEDDTWANMDEILTCMGLFQACIGIGKELNAEGKLGDECSPEWIVEEAKRRRPALRDDAAVPELDTLPSKRPSPNESNEGSTQRDILKTPAKIKKSSSNEYIGSPPQRETLIKPAKQGMNDSTDKGAHSIGRKVPKHVIFEELVWIELEKHGWSLETGNRLQDIFYIKPGVGRFKPFKKHIDWFDSLKKLMIFLQEDNEWSTKDEVKFGVKKYLHALKTYKKLISKKRLPPQWSPEWLVDQP